MIKLRILFLILFLFVPAYAFAQTSAIANKSWSAFWTQFSSAVRNKNKAAVRRLTAAKKDFSTAAGFENRDEWLQSVEQEKWWGRLQKSVKSGTKSYNYDGKLSRVTKDDGLIFAFSGGQWRCVGPMGD